jgi:hypothetical protein
MVQFTKYILEGKMEDLIDEYKKLKASESISIEDQAYIENAIEELSVCIHAFALHKALERKAP